MASASSTSARTLFVDSKLRLADRVQVNVNNIASVARQINRGSKSSEVKSPTLMHTAKNMALQEHAMENTEENLKKLQQSMAQLNQQFESIQRNAMLLDEVKEQVRAMQR
ncbi:BLOC-1-related complex subunit 7 [Frankliniella fusca]|uniref:BLOC-1-related complex subunit 7 n=1 Tax=Frankliniella fusca TaxID=407009 RepID=A0AAE1LR57_9NEOP|nr:BLOC-1-related complex subunit 7 [Frankliniella fusca]